MLTGTDYPMRPEKPPLPTPDFTAMEAALRDACIRARHAILPLAVMLQLYRSVATIARALMRARTDAGLAKHLAEDLILLLDAARDAACAHFPDPDMPVMDAIRIHRAIASLAGVAHHAQTGRRAVATVEAPQTPPEADPPPVPPPSEPTPEPPDEAEADEQAEAPDDFSLSAWRCDHKAERDQRAHELLRTVMEERVFTKIRAMNKADRERWAAEAAAEAEANQDT